MHLKRGLSWSETRSLLKFIETILKISAMSLECIFLNIFWPRLRKKLSWHIQQSFKFQLMFSNHFAFKSGESHVDCDLLLLLLWSNCSPNSNYILNPQPCIQKAQHRKLVGFNHAKKFPIKFGWRRRHTDILEKE